MRNFLNTKVILSCIIFASSIDNEINEKCKILNTQIQDLGSNTPNVLKCINADILDDYFTEDKIHLKDKGNKILRGFLNILLRFIKYFNSY